MLPRRRARRRPRLEPGPGGRQRPRGDRGLDRDRLPRRLRVRRDPDLAADHQRRRGCSRSRRRARRDRPGRARRRAPTTCRTLQPSGERTFGRVIPGDEAQAARGGGLGRRGSGSRRVAASIRRHGLRRDDGRRRSRTHCRGDRVAGAAAPARLLRRRPRAGRRGPSSRRAGLDGRPTPSSCRRSPRRADGDARHLGGARPVAAARRPAGAFVARVRRRYGRAAGPLRRLRLRGDGGRPRLDRPRRRPDRPRAR